jgi:glutamine amidotransferase
MLVIVDYDAGNIRSVVRAVEHCGGSPVVSSDAGTVCRASAVILPGVGAAAQAMERLTALGMDDALHRVVEHGVPLLGVCLGLQVALEHSEEGGVEGTRCLGLLPGVVRRFPPGPKVPHMGWNTVTWQQDTPLTAGITSESYFYFVHSYYAAVDADLTTGTATYGGVPFAAVLAHEQVFATQFHPEKSGADGLRIYRNFLTLAGVCS